MQMPSEELFVKKLTIREIEGEKQTRRKKEI